jgi:hypothetical protein
MEENVKSLLAGSWTEVVRSRTEKMPFPRRIETVYLSALALFVLLSLVPAVLPCQSLEELKVQISVGNTSVQRTPFFVKLIPSYGVSVDKQGEWRGTAGAGQVETQTYTLRYPKVEIQPVQEMHVIWSDLIAHSDADTVHRLTQDPAWRVDARKITVELNPEGTSGFSLTLDQLLQAKTFWIPSLDLYVSTGDAPASFSDTQRQLAQYAGMRILDQVEHAPEASYDAFKMKWADMGSPDYVHPVQEGPGHIVCLSWDSTLPKFGIDRGAGVWNDYGNPDRFRFWFEFANLSEGISPYWKSQTLQKGLPVITTVFERDSVHYEVEQFAYPLNGPPRQRQGDVNMVLLQRVRMTDLSGQARVVPVTMVHERSLPSQDDPGITDEHLGGQLLIEEQAHRNVLLAINPEGANVAWDGVQEEGQKAKRVDITLSVPLPANGTKEFLVSLPFPTIAVDKRNTLASLDYADARTRTLEFWSSYLAQGAQFDVPEQAVNDLFRANLWHALMLPRKHSDGQIDLPYSNFAYTQTGTPWPINQAVYVDYMLYGLRGYNKIATEELHAIYRNNQEFDGRLNGNAHWLAYTPGMLYAVAQDYLLSNDRESFEALLPDTLKALDWSIAQIQSASSALGPTRGLVDGPLNDLTGTGYWAFNQAYLYAGVELMGQALERDGNPRAAECLMVAQRYRAAIEHVISLASVQSPLVQLRDHTWIPYVPSNASEPGRNFQMWYPSDVDTGATHLLRLKALPAQGELANSLLNDQEDNLFLHGWGLANEPVYNQQATAYLIRDDVKASINAFYSLMAGGFSHSVYEPVEHRWRWGQYFGPPSTDGAWFELYRNILVREADDHTLFLAQSTPRAWLEDGMRISVKNAPTWFGNISFEVRSSASTGSIEASLQLEARQPGTTILLRIRHPQGKLMQHVTVNGRPWKDFDPTKEWVRIPSVGKEKYLILASYSR